MKEVRGEVLQDMIRLYLSGRIDSNNAREVEEAASEVVRDHPGGSLLIDAEDLQYVSSAGLRFILRLRKSHPDLKIINVSTEIYEILDMTGFTQMMTIEKAYRVVSIEGAEEIGRGANGTIYRIDQDNVVKVYNDADALADIQNEREVARKALVLGIPTAISYDVVKVGDSYGSVFELLNAKSFSSILANEPEKMDWCVSEYVELLKKIHSTVVPEGQLPDVRKSIENWDKFLKDYLPEETFNKLKALIDEVPYSDHMVHGDYHTKNVVLVDDEVLLIDMDTLAVGHPVYELAYMFNAFIGFSEADPDVIMKFQGFSHETAVEFWDKVLKAYLGTENEKQIRAVEDKVRVIGYTRMLRRLIRKDLHQTPEGKAELETWLPHLIEVVGRTDSLLFSTNEIIIEAVKDNLPVVTEFVEKTLEEAGCPMKEMMQIGLAVEEIFVNICNYAYTPDTGDASISIDLSDDQASVTLKFADRGVPFDPLKKEDPDITSSAEERKVGGLGIYMVRNTMDDVEYEYVDGQNILTIRKNI